jgi:hypothetical protein
MSARDPSDAAAGEQVVHRDFLPSAARGMPPVPEPWHTLSRAQCLMLAMAWHRAAQMNRPDDTSVVR